MKTSASHPIRVDWVYIDDQKGKVGITFCPGKKQKYAMTGSWNRDLDMDMTDLKDKGCDALVTLMEAHELEAVEVPMHQLEKNTQTHGMDWFFLPIKDTSIPDGNFERSWNAAGKQLIDLLNDKQSIVVHCLGGLGRSGTIAARLLVELGIDPDDAIIRVRQSRPGAIETKAQEQYVRQKGWLS
jgi:ADP-ribosyl-[dinitrogen reductase] hydrolase